MGCVHVSKRRYYQTLTRIDLCSDKNANDAEM